MKDRLAISKYMALKLFWDNGWTSEAMLKKANGIIESTKQAAPGYWYADEICERLKG